MLTPLGLVLFYCAFVAMKHQDRRPIAHDDLLDGLALVEGGEEIIFGGVIKDEGKLHALRMFKDRGSGVVRLEACALRGPMNDVPIWTAFVNRYVGDLDWMQLERGGIVSLAALRPPPYVFLAGYEPPRSMDNDYLLQFTTTEGEFLFLALCRSCACG